MSCHGAPARSSTTKWGRRGASTASPGPRAAAVQHRAASRESECSPAMARLPLAQAAVCARRVTHTHGPYSHVHQLRAPAAESCCTSTRQRTAIAHLWTSRMAATGRSVAHLQHK